MDTESAVAIICAVVALVLLISMAVFTMVKAWKKISRELAEKEHAQLVAPNVYENIDCIENERALSDNDVTKASELAQATADRGQTADLYGNAEMSCTHSDQAVNKRVLVHVETNHDTSF